MEPIWQLLNTKQNDEQWNNAHKGALRSALAGRQFTQLRVKQCGWSTHERCLFCLWRLVKRDADADLDDEALADKQAAESAVDDLKMVAAKQAVADAKQALKDAQGVLAVEQGKAAAAQPSADDGGINCQTVQPSSTSVLYVQHPSVDTAEAAPWFKSKDQPKAARHILGRALPARCFDPHSRWFQNQQRPKKRGSDARHTSQPPLAATKRPASAHG